MADDPKDRPSLELPKLSLRRKRRPAPREADPEAAPEATPDATPEATPDAAPEAETVRPVEDTRPLAVADPAPAAAPSPTPPEPPRERPERGPGGLPAAALTGLVVGLGIVGLTWASLRGCEGVQGTSSCGDAGYPLLGLILVVMVLLGGQLLRFLRVADPASTSFLGVGLTCVVALLVLVDHLLDRSMVLVIPLLCAATFALAHWVTRTFIEPPDR